MDFTAQLIPAMTRVFLWGRDTLEHPVGSLLISTKGCMDSKPATAFGSLAALELH